MAEVIKDEDIVNNKEVINPNDIVSKPTTGIPGEGVAETAAHMVTGGLGKIAGDVVGLSRLGVNGVGHGLRALGVPEKYNPVDMDIDPTQIKEDIENGMTYQPRTQAGQDDTAAVNSAVSNTLGRASNAAGNYAASKVSNPILADMLRDGVRETVNQAASMALPVVGKAAGAVVGSALKTATPYVGDAVSMASRGMNKVNNLADKAIQSKLGSITGAVEAVQHPQAIIPAVAAYGTSKALGWGLNKLAEKLPNSKPVDIGFSDANLKNIPDSYKVSPSMEPTVTSPEKLPSPMEKATAVEPQQLTQSVKENPDFWGMYSRPLMEAGNRGPDSVIATSFVLQKTDPEFRKKIQDWQDNQRGGDTTSSAVTGEDVQQD